MPVGPEHTKYSQKSAAAAAAKQPKTPLFSEEERLQMQREEENAKFSNRASELQRKLEERRTVSGQVTNRKPKSVVGTAAMLLGATVAGALVTAAAAENSTYGDAYNGLLGLKDETFPVELVPTKAEIAEIAFKTFFLDNLFAQKQYDSPVEALLKTNQDVIKKSIPGLDSIEYLKRDEQKIAKFKIGSFEHEMKFNEEEMHIITQYLVNNMANPGGSEKEVRRIFNDEEKFENVMGQKMQSFREFLDKGKVKISDDEIAKNLVKNMKDSAVQKQSFRNQMGAFKTLGIIAIALVAGLGLIRRERPAEVQGAEQEQGEDDRQAQQQGAAQAEPPAQLRGGVAARRVAENNQRGRGE